MANEILEEGDIVKHKLIDLKMIVIGHESGQDVAVEYYLHDHGFLKGSFPRTSLKFFSAADNDFE